MRKFKLSLLFVLLIFAGQIIGCAYESYNRVSYAPAYGTEVRVGFFYDSLQPHGRWFRHNRYGWVWYPYNVPVDWRPYTDGYWALTDHGWTWVSSRPWGWACFHYGRWFFDSAHGWCWYPDTVWAPAWVFWRTGGDWIGWAPLPPEAVWRARGGLAFSDYDAGRHVSPFSYCFVRRNEFFEPDLPRRIVLHARNVTLIRQTNITVNNIRQVNERVVNEFPDEGRFENEFKDRVRRFRVAEAEAPGPAQVRGDEVAVYRPERGRQPAAAPRREERQAIPTQQPAMEQRREIQQPVIERQDRDQEQARDRGRDRDEEKITIPAPKQRVTPAPALQSQRDAEARALEQEQTARKRTLEQTHSQELVSPPEGAKPAEIRKEQKNELKAFREQAAREKHLLRKSQQEEATTQDSEQKPGKKHFKVPRDGEEQEDR